MEIETIISSFSVCKVVDFSKTDFDQKFTFIGHTDEEKSLVCPTEFVPCNTIEREDGWRGFRIKGVLDFSLLGILSKIATILAEHGISIFAVSTYNTDYIFVKENVYETALSLVREI